MRATAPLVAVLLVSFVGCKKKEATDNTPEAKGSTDDPTSQRSMQVMNFYVDFFNEVIRDAPAPLKQYYRRAGDDGLSVETMTKWANVVCGPTWMEMKRKNAGKKLDKAKKASTGEFANMPPLGDAMLAKGVALVEARDEMCTYVKSGEFKKDSGAKAKEFHTKILAAQTEWSAAVGGLAAQLDRIEDAQTMSEIKKHEAAKGQSYWFRYASMRSNQMLRAARRGPDELAEAIGPAREAVADAQEYAKAQAGKLNKSFEGYMKQVDRMAKALEQLEAGLARAKEPADKVDLIDKQFGNLVSIYNTMVSLYNTLIQAEARGELK